MKNVYVFLFKLLSTKVKLVLFPCSSSYSNPSVFQIAIRATFLRNKYDGVILPFMNLAGSPLPKG